MPTVSIQEGTISNRKRSVLIALCAIVFTFALPRAARAATLFLSPSNGTFRANEAFTATVRVNTAGASINAAEGVVSFDPTFLRVDSITADGSIFNLNVQEPEYSNTAGTVNFAGVILNPGYTGSSGTLLTIRFRTRAAGTTSVSFSSGAVLANDGQGTNVLSSLSGATYGIVGSEPTPPPQTTAAPPQPPTDSLTPIVTSPTHPTSERWYANNDPRFTWILPAGVTGVSWLVADNPSGNPGNRLDGLVDRVQFENVKDGISYFHIKFQKNGSFGPIAHYEFRVDTVSPEPFTIRRTNTDDTDPQPQLVYVTDDATSGVQRYRMRVGSGDWFDVPEAPEDHPFRMPLQAPGVHPVTVEAVDGAGLTSRAELVVSVTSIAVPEITTYPEQVDPNDPFAVGGTAEPNSTVTVRAWRVGPVAGLMLSDRPYSMASAVADASGRWRARFDGVPVGTYELIADATDARGAVSYASTAVTVRSGNWFVRQFRSLPYWFSALPWWAKAVLIGVMALVAWLITFIIRRQKKKVVAVAKKDRRVKNGLEDLIDDIELELSTLDRLAKSRPLYPEERYLRTKLTEYRKTLRKLAGKRKASARSK